MSDTIFLGDVPERNAARLGAGRWAVRHGDTVLTWGELTERSLRRAHALAARGVGQDDLVVLALPNANAFYELTFAIWKLGATPMVVSPRLPEQELLHILDAVQVRAIVSENPALATLGALPMEFGREHPDTSALPSRAAKHWKAMTSGGSTGRPKIIIDHHPSRLPVMKPTLFLPPDGVILNPAPLYHNFPFALSHMAMLHGCSVVSMAKFDAETLLQQIEQYRVQWLNLVPTMMGRIARLPPETRNAYDLSSLQTLWHTAAPVAPWLKELWIDWLGPERIWEMYGGSEGFCTTQLNGREWLAHRGSVGKPIVGELRIRDEGGAELPAGQVGEIYMRGPSGKRPTYHYVGAESRRLDDGFESFGDYGWLDADGYLYIADRRTDMIVSGGANLYPAEIEGVLMAHPQVHTAVVIGLPDDDLGAIAHAIIQVEPGQSAPAEAALRDFMAQRLTLSKTPRSYEFTEQALRDEAGKVRRSRLRDERIAARMGLSTPQR